MMVHEDTAAGKDAAAGVSGLAAANYFVNFFKSFALMKRLQNTDVRAKGTPT